MNKEQKPKPTEARPVSTTSDRDTAKADAIERLACGEAQRSPTVAYQSTMTNHDIQEASIYITDTSSAEHRGVWLSAGDVNAEDVLYGSHLENLACSAARDLGYIPVLIQDPYPEETSPGSGEFMTHHRWLLRSRGPLTDAKLDELAISMAAVVGVPVDCWGARTAVATGDSWRVWPPTLQ